MIFLNRSTIQLYVVFAMGLMISFLYPMEKQKKERFFLKPGKPYKISLHTIKKGERDPQTTTETTEDLSFIGLAKSRAQRLENIKDLLTIRTPKKYGYDDVSSHNIGTRYRAIINLLQNGSEAKDFDQEHIRVKVVFALLEELVSIYLYHVKVHALSDDRAKMYQEMIKADKKKYYKDYCYRIAEKYKEKGKQLFSQAKDENEDFYKILFFLTSNELINNARFFYEKMLTLVDKEDGRDTTEEDAKEIQKSNKVIKKPEEESQREKRKEDLQKIKNAEIFLNNIPFFLKQTMRKIKKLKNYECAQEKLLAVKTIHKKATISLEHIEELQDLIKAVETKAALPPKRKEEREGLKEFIQERIRREIIKMDKEIAKKNEHDQRIREFSALLKKKNHNELALKVKQLDLSERKSVLLKKLTKLEKKYIKVATLYLEIFRLVPQKKYIVQAQNAMEKVSEVGGRKIEISSYITFPYEIHTLWGEIKKAQNIIEHQDRRELFGIMREAKALKVEAAHQWMI